MPLPSCCLFPHLSCECLHCIIMSLSLRPCLIILTHPELPIQGNFATSHIPNIQFVSVILAFNLIFCISQSNILVQILCLQILCIFERLLGAELSRNQGSHRVLVTGGNGISAIFVWARTNIKYLIFLVAQMVKNLPAIQKIQV